MTTNSLRIARTGAPEPVSTHQREVALSLLRAAGDAGINRDHFLMGTGPCSGHRMTQVGARLDELEEQGFIFESFKANEADRFVTYRLISEPVTRVERPKFRVKKRKTGAEQTSNVTPIEHQPPATLRQAPALTCPPADAKVAVRIADVTPGQSLLFSDAPPATHGCGPIVCDRCQGKPEGEIASDCGRSRAVRQVYRDPESMQ